MRVDVLNFYRLRLAGSVAVVALATLMAGCSSDVARFDDGFYTGAVPKQPVPRGNVGRQAYPGDLDQASTGSVRPAYGNNPGAGVRQEAAPLYSAQTPGNRQYGAVTRTASVERSMLAPQSSAPSANDQTYSQPAPMPAAQTPREAPSMAAAPAPSRATASGKAGWQNTGNNVTLGGNETVDTLADRYGVPAKAILAANGLKSASDARPGQQIAIPTYSYGSTGVRTAAVAPSNPNAPALGSAPQPLRPPERSAARGAGIVVESGDSLMGISRRTGVPVSELRAANGLTDDNIRIGQTLKLPAGASAPKRVAALEPKPAEVLAPVQAPKPVAATQPKPYEAPKVAAVKVEKPAAAPVAAAPAVAAAPVPAAEPVKAAPTSTVSDQTENEVATAAPAGTGIEQFRWPVQGRVVKRYGEKSGARRSDGLDISVPRGTPVKAAENGVVIYAGDGLKEFGNTVLVKHDNGLVTVYGHADELKVKRGATVRRGQEIATAGVSGDTDTPMVHFEVRKNSAPVDPAKYLQ